MQTNNTAASKQIKIGNYILGKTIGKGNSAVVKIATHAILKQKVAIKMFDKSVLDSDKQYRLMCEIESMKSLKHPNIIRIYEIMETAKIIFIVTEIASNGELYDYIIHKKRLSEREARHIFKQIVVAVNHCHTNNIVHRDIKVENILLDSNWRVKLADFGFSSFFKPGELMDTWCGSPQYCAPELYLAKMYEGPSVDIWSLGVVLYVLVCGYLPFEAQLYNVLKSQVISGSYKIPFFLSEDCKNLINGMLTLDPLKRFKMNDIINHKWLQSEGDLSINMSCTMTELTIFKEFKNLTNKIEQISINESEQDNAILLEISKYGLDIAEILESVRKNEFDSNAAIYYLLEAKLKANNLNQADTRLTKKINESMPTLLDLQNALNYKTCESKTSDELISTIVANSGLNAGFIHSETPNALMERGQIIYDNIMNEAESAIHDFNIITQKINEENDQDEEEGLLVEKLGRDYLYRCNGIKRHTIGTNVDNKRESEIVKSVECLHRLLPNGTNNLAFNSDLDFAPLQEVSFKTFKANNLYDQVHEAKTYSGLNELIKPQHKKIYNHKNSALIQHQHLNSNYKTLKSKQTKFQLGASQHQRLLNNEGDSLYAGYRRASDGGSNISTFNQIYSSKHVDAAHESSGAGTCQIKISDQCENDYSQLRPIKRGSITSGIPIFHASSSSQLSPTTSSDSQNLNSSEDEEFNSNIMRYTRKNSRPRHEPYMESQMSPICLSLNTTNRNKSFGDSISPPLMSNTIDFYNKRNQSDPLELIQANRAHLERIYNQSINKTNTLPPTKELLILQQENPSIDEETQIKWQNQHRNSLRNQLNFSKEAVSDFVEHHDHTLHTSDADHLDLESSVVQMEANDSTESDALNIMHSLISSLNSNKSQNNSQTLQMIQEEQNEMNLLASNASSASNTPRTSEPFIFFNKLSLDPSTLFEHELQLLSILNHANTMSNVCVKTLNEFNQKHSIQDKTMYPAI